MVGNKGLKSVSNNPRIESGMKKIAFSARCTSIKVKQDKNDWFIDSCASDHMTPYAELLDNKVEVEKEEILIADNSKMSVNCAGKTILNISKKEIEVNNVLHVPKVSSNLLSVAKIVSQGNTVVFNENGCTIYNTSNEVISHCKEKDGVYKIRSQQGMYGTMYGMFAHVNKNKPNQAKNLQSKVWTKSQRLNLPFNGENSTRPNTKDKLVSVRDDDALDQMMSSLMVQMRISLVGPMVESYKLIWQQTRRMLSEKYRIMKLLAAY